MAVILIAEDEKNMQNIIIEYMKRGSHSCIVADDGIDAVTILKNNPVDLAILDIMMPHLDGFSVCKIAREMYSIPIIFLTAKEGEDDKLKGYELGADDYMTKPFSPKVLLAKVNALLRRSSPENIQETLTAGNLALIPASHKVIVSGDNVDLTYKEFELLRLFMSSPGVAFTREKLLTSIWDSDYSGETRTVDMHIRTLRQKLGSYGAMIETIRNVGYRLEVKP